MKKTEWQNQMCLEGKVTDGHAKEIFSIVDNLLKEQAEENSRKLQRVYQEGKQDGENNTVADIKTIRNNVIDEVVAIMKSKEEWCLQPNGYAAENQEEEIYLQGFEDMRAYKLIKILSLKKK